MNLEDSLGFLNEEYLAQRGISQSGRLRLIDALKDVLDSKEPQTYTEPTEGLTESEREVLKQGGLRLERTSTRDLVSETALEYAELVASSMGSSEAAKRLGVTPTRVRQMIGECEIYSFILNGKRLIPRFQFQETALISNIRLVNRALNQNLHPVGVWAWFHEANSELAIDSSSAIQLSPLQWLSEGRDPNALVFLAENL